MACVPNKLERAVDRSSLCGKNVMSVVANAGFQGAAAHGGKGRVKRDAA
jgi:hypothetical protein